MIFDAIPTEAQILEEMSTREQKIWYVTQHFSDLQGLKGAPIFTGMLLIMYLVPRGSKHLKLTLSIFGGLLFFVILWIRWISRWYRERYDLAMPVKPSLPETLPGYSVVVLLILIIYIGCAIYHRGSFVSFWVFFTAENFFLRKCFYLAPASFAIRFRRVLYIAGMLAATGSVLCLTYTQTRGSFTILYALLWSFLLLSLYDHWLLDHLLRQQRRFQ